ncbi:MAG: MBL fold metallo-hydrolase [Candidatus Thorarchaeota archaeon]
MLADVDEWTENVWKLSLDDNTCYLVKCDEENFVVIDTGASASMGESILKQITDLGYNNDNLKAIFLTCCHPDHLGGLKLLKKHTQAELYVHESAKPIFEEGKSYVMEKQFSITGTGEKLLLAWGTNIIENVIDLPEPNHYIKGGEDINIGDEIFVIESTGGHSADHILVHAYKLKVTFIGDELGIYQDSEYSFFFDLTGSPEQRKKALRVFAKLKSIYLFPTHLPPIEHSDIDQITQEAILAQEHFETTVLETLSGYGKVKLKNLINHVLDTLAIEWKSPYKELGVAETTLLVYLKKLITEKVVSYDEKSKYYSYIEVESGLKDDEQYRN